MSDIALVGRGLVGHPALEGSEGGTTGGHRAGDSAAFGRPERMCHRFNGTPEQGTEALNAPSACDVDRWQRSLRASDGVRWGLIDQVRASIQRGDYLTDDRLAAAMPHLALDLSH